MVSTRDELLAKPPGFMKPATVPPRPGTKEVQQLLTELKRAYERLPTQDRELVRNCLLECRG